MSEHVIEWLSAYVDDELRGGRLNQVEKHLAECQACQAEMESLQNLSMLLCEVPAPKLPSPERFKAQVNLRLPRNSPKATKRKSQEVGWWMIPVSLLLVWIFIGTTTVVSDVVSTVSGFGLLKGAPIWLTTGSSAGAYWSDRLGEFGMLNGNGLKWAEQTEVLTRNTLPPIIWQVSIALLYLSWIAIWWARYTRQEHGRPIES